MKKILKRILKSYVFPNKSRDFIRGLIMTFILVFGVLAAVSPASCRLSEEGIEIVPEDTVAPSIEDFSISGSDLISVSCSEKIVLDNIFVVEVEENSESATSDYSSTEDENVFASAKIVTYSEDGKSAEITLDAQTVVGKSYICSGVIYDINGNSLSFSQKFCGFNEHPAKLIFNEIRVKNDKSSNSAEFIEFYTLKSGNTYGLEIVSAANGEVKKYSFPAIEVTDGEYITVHGRIYEDVEDVALDELEDDFAISMAKDSCDTARDLWKSGNEKIVSANDVVVLRDSISKAIKDAVLLHDSKTSNWSKKTMGEYAEKAHSLGIWTSGSGASNAFCTDNATTIHRTVSRKNTEELAEKYRTEEIPEYIPTSEKDWILTEKTGSGKNLVSGATPGGKNSTNIYVKSSK